MAYENQPRKIPRGILWQENDPPPPLFFDNEPINFEKNVKYLRVYLDSTLTGKPHIDYIIKKFYTLKNDLAHLLYSNEMSINNKVLLYKTVLRPIFLYAAPIWVSAANTIIQKVQILQNKLLRSTCKFPWCFRNQTIHNTLKVEPIRKFIKNLSQNFCDNIPAIPSPELFNLPDYDPRQFYKRPKASIFISIGINYK